MSGAGLAIEVAGWLAGSWRLWRVPRLSPDRPGRRAACSDVAVLVPARDEAANLATLLASLGTQRPPPREVIVVDDHSADATAAIARAAGATVVAAGPLPPGWTGKALACATAAEAATAATLVFLDADTELEPGGLARVTGERRRRGGLVSVQPFHVVGRPYEALSAFFNLVSMMGSGAFTPRRDPRPTVAFGPCLACSAADYRTAGGHGHEAVRGAVVEDVALARRFAAAGLPVSVFGGKDAIRFRMYPGGVAQLVEGWTKNIATGASTTGPVALAMTCTWVAGGITAAWSLATVPTAVTALAYLAYAAQIGSMLHRIGRFPWWTAPAYPVPLAFFLAVFARSVVHTRLRGEVRWRGRTIHTRTTRPSPTPSGPAEPARARR